MNIETHLLDRRCDISLYSGVSLDLEKSVATFPLWNLSGQWVGFQQYKPLAPKSGVKPSECKYFTYMTKVNGKSHQYAFGLELLDISKPYCFIAEGIFDVTPIHLLGQNALALLTNNPKSLEFIKLMPYKTVALCDGDKAGEKLAKYADTVIRLPKNKDPGDMPATWFKEMVESL